MKVGFIGVGTMGRHMAANLMKSKFSVVVNDMKKEAAASHLKDGATWADTPKDVAAASDVVFTSLPGPADVEAVALGDNGILAGMSPGKVYFDLSTNSPTVVRRIEAVFKARGVHMLDAPVSGGPKGAQSGKLAIWVGGDEGIFQKCKSVLDGFSDQAVYVGAIGAGSVAKLVHNCAGYMMQTALAEVFTMGVKAGVDPLVIWKAVRQGAGGRRRTFDGLADQFLPGKFDPRRSRSGSRTRTSRSRRSSAAR
jgi:3-hydroxyisobutyrate dehydrogenase